MAQTRATAVPHRESTSMEPTSYYETAWIVRTTKEYAQATEPRQYIAELPKVILVATNVGPTDLRISDNDFLLEKQSRPEVVPLRDVPWLVFRHLRGSECRVNAQYLVDMSDLYQGKIMLCIWTTMQRFCEHFHYICPRYAG